MKETEEAAAAAEAKAGGSQGSSKKEIEIPKELRMGWKDEMKTESSLGTSTPQRMPAETTTTSSGDSDVDTAAALAEGFVQTGPPASVGGTQGSIVPAATQQGHPPPQPPQFPPVPSPQPTRTAPLPNPGPPAAHQHQGGGVVARNVQAERPVVNQAVPGQLAVAQQRRRNTVTDESLNDGVPIWVDRAIVAVGAVVLALLVRILFG